MAMENSTLTTKKGLAQMLKGGELGTWSPLSRPKLPRRRAHRR
jgi:hypothetical protein